MTWRTSARTAVVPIDAVVPEGEQSPLPLDPSVSERFDGAYDRLTEFVSNGYSTAAALEIVATELDFGSMSVSAVMAAIEAERASEDAEDLHGPALLQPGYTISRGGGSRSGKKKSKPRPKPTGRPWIEDEPRTIVRTVRMTAETAKRLRGKNLSDVVAEIARADDDGEAA